MLCLCRLRKVLIRFDKVSLSILRIKLHPRLDLTSKPLKSDQQDFKTIHVITFSSSRAISIFISIIFLEIKSIHIFKSFDIFPLENRVDLVTLHKICHNKENDWRIF